MWLNRLTKTDWNFKKPLLLTSKMDQGRNTNFMKRLFSLKSMNGLILRFNVTPRSLHSKFYKSYTAMSHGQHPTGWPKLKHKNKEWLPSLSKPKEWPTCRVGWHNKRSQTGWLITTKVYSLTVLEPVRENSKSLGGLCGRPRGSSASIFIQFLPSV